MSIIKHLIYVLICQSLLVSLAIADNLSSLGEVNLANANAGAAVNIDSAEGILLNPASANATRMSFAIQHNNSSRSGYADWQSKDRQLASFAMTWQSTTIPEVNLGIAYFDNANFDNSWQQGQLLKFKENNLAANLAWQVNNKLKLGSSIGVSNGELDFKSYEANKQNNFSAKENIVFWRLGMIYQLSPRMRLGLSYTPEQKFKLNTVGENKSAQITLPANLVWSVAQRLNENWESLGSLAIHYKGGQMSLSDANANKILNDTWLDKNSLSVAWGANYQINNNWQSNFGVSYQRYRGAKSSSLFFNEANRYSLALGTKWQMQAETSLELAYRYQFSRPYSVNTEQNGESNIKKIQQQQLKLQLNHNF